MKDNFSHQADAYAKYRPGYPPELFDFILKYVEGRSAAWDCATGNGQSAMSLAKHFERVFATDISQKQLDHAPLLPNVSYTVQPAEQTDFPPDSFDLVTVSQALHWFRFDDFYKEVKRVLKPGGWIAAWMYSGVQVSPEIDERKKIFYRDLLGSWWDYERRYVDEEYKTIPFPLEEISCPVFQLRFDWTLEEFAGYLNTWSALQKFIKANHYNPVGQVVEDIRDYWVDGYPDQNRKRIVTFPVCMRMGRVNK